MIVLGDISGIQSYVFDVPESGGGQARRLRARSFLVQALAECAALRCLEVLNWKHDQDHFPFSGAGKFILRGEGDRSKLGMLAAELNGELLNAAGGELRLSLGVGEGESEVAAYAAAQNALHAAKSSPWKPLVAWNPNELVLKPLDTPCDLCRRDKAEVDEHDPETGETRRICRTCQNTFQLGQRMPGANAIAYRRGTGGDIEWLGFRVDFIRDAKGSNDHTRPIRAGIPISHGKPIEFLDLAGEAAGDKLLAVLKADVDSLGKEIETRLQTGDSLEGFLGFAQRLDGFFSDRLQSMIEGRPIYSVFSGGDDLVMIGPWDEMFLFAGAMREAFRQESPSLTLSAGLAVFKPKRPVKLAVEQAETLLEAAKAVEGKDSCAGFGQVWKWEKHSDILAEANRLIGWVNGKPNPVQRGWLHTILELAEARSNGDPMATARLAYHVSRNWPKVGEARDWANELVHNFDTKSHPTVQYLPAVLRYALTATRKPNERE